MNCQAEILSNQGKFFAKVFVCEKCHTIAEHLYKRAHRDARSLLAMMETAISIGLRQGKLQFRSIDQVEEIDKVELLTRLAEITQEIHKREVKTKEECQDSKTETPSSESLKPHVATLAAIGHASSKKSSPPATGSETK